MKIEAKNKEYFDTLETDSIYWKLAFFVEDKHVFDHPREGIRVANYWLIEVYKFCENIKA